MARASPIYMHATSTPNELSKVKNHANVIQQKTHTTLNQDIAQYVLAYSELMNVRGAATCSTGIACGTTNRFIDRNIHKQVVADLSQRLITTLYLAQQSQSDWCTTIHIAGLQNYM